MKPAFTCDQRCGCWPRKGSTVHVLASLKTPAPALPDAQGSAATPTARLHAAATPARTWPVDS